LFHALQKICYDGGYEREAIMNEILLQEMYGLLGVEPNDGSDFDEAGPPPIPQQHPKARFAKQRPGRVTPMAKGSRARAGTKAKAPMRVQHPFLAQKRPSTQKVSMKEMLALAGIGTGYPSLAEAMQLPEEK